MNSISDEQWEKDWRNNGQDRYLNKAVLYRRKYKAPSKSWQHDHCAFCWARFSVDFPGDLHEGYATGDNYWWICDECYADLKDIFKWTVFFG